MVRAPSVENMGLKKGPWTPEEDQRLMAYIERHGHGNWRALPKEAGLLRCGKSCRLRWMNYLRPDIKRGNFSIEEEETIVNLFELMGSRWSAIARKLPGRTDNEIKNIWHTHLKKRLKWDHLPQQTKRRCTETPVRSSKSLINNLTSTNLENPDDVTSSPLPSSSDFSSTTTNSSVVVSENTVMELYKNPLSEAFSPENCCNPEDFPVTMSELQLVSSPVYLEDHLYLYDDADIWLNVKEEWDAKIAGI